MGCGMIRYLHALCYDWIRVSSIYNSVLGFRFCAKSGHTKMKESGLCSSPPAWKVDVSRLEGGGNLWWVWPG